jgi:predicted nucleic acid-binding protein
MAISKPWVVNASPLIVLGKIGRLDLLESFTASIVVPGSVIREIAVGSDDDPDTETTLAWATARTVADIPLPSAVAHWDLGAGESQVLARCLADGGVAVLDDGEARACAQSLGLPLIGTLGVILRARKSGVIPAARPLVNRMLATGSRLSPGLVEAALRQVGE